MVLGKLLPPRGEVANNFNLPLWAGARDNDTRRKDKEGMSILMSASPLRSLEAIQVDNCIS